MSSTSRSESPQCCKSPKYNASSVYIPWSKACSWCLTASVCGMLCQAASVEIPWHSGRREVGSCDNCSRYRGQDTSNDEQVAESFWVEQHPDTGSQVLTSGRGHVSDEHHIQARSQVQIWGGGHVFWTDPWTAHWFNYPLPSAQNVRCIQNISTYIAAVRHKFVIRIKVLTVRYYTPNCYQVSLLCKYT